MEMAASGIDGMAEGNERPTLVIKVKAMNSIRKLLFAVIWSIINKFLVDHLNPQIPPAAYTNQLSWTIFFIALLA